MFMYVFLGAGALASTRVLAAAQARSLTDADWLVVGLAHGLALMLAVLVAQRFSGAHINPAVTLALAVVQHTPCRSVLRQIVAQYAGAIGGAAAIFIVLGQSAATVGHFGAPDFGTHISMLQSMVIEALGTAILMLAQMGASADSRAPQGWGPLTLGMTVAAVTFFIGPVTSATVNPARAFGPDLLSQFFGNSVSWPEYVVADLIGPVLGAVLAAVVYILIAHPLLGDRRWFGHQRSKETGGEDS